MSPSQGFSQAELDQALAGLPAPFVARLLSLYASEPQRGCDGELHAIDSLTKIPPVQGRMLYDLCRSIQPRSTLEIGMAYGFSSQFILAALAHNQKGHHTAIDPVQKSYWHGIGLTLALEAFPQPAEAERFRLMEDRSDRAATDLAREGQSFDLIFIDGNHRYDDVLVDFYLYAQLVSEGGFIVLDDMWMPSVKTAADFIRTNRHDFKEVASPARKACLFQKIGDDSRNWNHFNRFRVF
ncbi:MAG: class I SAM-dependent methyltransferase [Cyanobacteriota bacterium]|nr:class I SAM-dependent methyltransferase [Cyanobacteriota bacterium]